LETTNSFSAEPTLWDTGLGEVFWASGASGGSMDDFKVITGKFTTKWAHRLPVRTVVESVTIQQQEREFKMHAYMIFKCDKKIFKAPILKIFIP